MAGIKRRISWAQQNAAKRAKEDSETCNKAEKQESTSNKMQNHSLTLADLHRLRKERSSLLFDVNKSPPPSWAEASKIWLRIDEIENILENCHRNT